VTVIDNIVPFTIEATQLRSPVTRAGYEYWLSKKGHRPFPSRADFDPLLEQPRLARNLVLLEVLRDPIDFRYRLIGTRVRDHMRTDWTGLRMSEIPMQCAPNPIWQHQLWILEHKAPRFYRPAYLGPYREVLVIETGEFPMGPAGGDIDMILVVVDFMMRSSR